MQAILDLNIQMRNENEPNVKNVNFDYLQYDIGNTTYCYDIAEVGFDYDKKENNKWKMSGRIKKLLPLWKKSDSDEDEVEVMEFENSAYEKLLEDGCEKDSLIIGLTDLSDGNEVEIIDGSILFITDERSNRLPCRSL